MSTVKPKFKLQHISSNSSFNIKVHNKITTSNFNLKAQPCVSKINLKLQL